MKNIPPALAQADISSYKNIVKGTRKPQKPVLVAQQLNVETALNNYRASITGGSANPLNFTPDEHGYHYKLYDSESSAVVALKTALTKNYFGHFCPYCQLDTVSHIDHFLPRAHFPEFSTSLQNLLMSCDICNTTHKKANWGNGQHQHILHPQLNSLPNQIFLCAVANYVSKSIVVDFSIQQGLLMSQLLQRHFVKMDLNSRYKAKVTLIEVPKMARIILEETDPARKVQRLQNFVSDQIVSNPLNSWESAFYRAVQPIVPIVAFGGL